MYQSAPFRRLAAITPRQFYLALALIVALVSLQYTLKVIELRNGKQDRSAILRWREQLLQIDSGENIYQKYTYPNPPIMALMLRPLAELPPLGGALVWFYLKVALAVLSFAGIIRLVATKAEPFPPWAAGLAVLLSIRPILGDLTHGNVNLLILFLVVGTLFTFQRGWDVTAGIILALAIACKVTPALFVAYFVWKRAWRALAGCGLGLILFFFVVPALALGWAENWELLSSWFQQMVMPYVMGGVVTSDHPNQSLPGLVFRLLTHSPSFSTYIDDIYTPVEYHNVLALSPSAAGWIVKAVMALFVGVVIWVCRTPLRERAGWRFAAECSLIIIGMLLFSERTWKHHCVTLSIPFAVLCHRLANAPTHRARLVLAIVAAQVLTATTSQGLLPDDWARLAQVYGAFVGTFVVIVIALTIELRTTPPAAENARQSATAAAA